MNSLKSSSEEDRIFYNHNQHVVILNFQRVKIKSKEDFERLANQICQRLEAILKTTGRKVDCIVNYDFMEISEELFDSYVELCVKNTKKYFSNCTRYGEKDKVFVTKLEEAFMKRNEIAPNVFHPEETLGNYILRETLGSGTFGIVKLGICKSTGQKVAIKIVDKEIMSDCEGLEFIEKEIKIHSNLNHGNIVRFIETFQTPSKIFLVMDFVKGGKLESLIEFDKLPESTAKILFLQLLDALEYLHASKITHRDLHPGNIMVDMETKSLKIIDFGCSDHFSKDETFDMFIGKSMYACPEMLFQQKYKGDEADLWSLGICLFKMVTGYEAFRFTNNLKNREFTIPLEHEPISQECKDLLDKMLKFDPKERLTIKEIRNHPWLLNTF